ncbi:MAG: RtcB family protein [Planctomyces sp.]
MKARELDNLGVPKALLKLAAATCADLAKAGRSRHDVRETITNLLARPGQFVSDEVLGPFARALVGTPESQRTPEPKRDQPAPLNVWGLDDPRLAIDAAAMDQARDACRLPISAACALMPEAHVGYGLPIGGVLATVNCVIPYAVGVDIACRMKLSVLDIPAQALADAARRRALVRAIESCTRFGVGAEFQKPHEHDVLDADWTVSPVTRRLKDKARAQLGTSGSGNHFVEWGVLTITDEHAKTAADPALLNGLAPGQYLALLSHSGSRGTGAAVCDHYSRIAMDLHPHLDPALRRLAWLDLDSEPGREYWMAMNLMGQYAAANHACIHDSIARELGATRLLDIENHHNFAWLETHDIAGLGRREVVVHRKGATPAGEGVLGVIPGSMNAPGFVVRGKGETASLASASHGAGRVMSRTRAREAFVWGNVRRELEAGGVELLSAGIDEAPGVYKDIHAVIAAQSDLIDVVARFDPRIVKMAPEGERAED